MLKVAHLGSFIGNIGDNANHAGFRAMLAEALPEPLEYTEIEIRQFFWKQRFFDRGFAEICNAHDFVIIGGGNFFELWVENSATGTSIDIAPEILAQIKVPILFNALGCDPHMGAPEPCVERFRQFLSQLLASPQFMVTVRNDGALGNMARVVGEAFAAKVARVPDGGFFFDPPKSAHPEVPEGKRAIVINIAGDMLELRFQGSGGMLNPEGFFDEMAGFLSHLLQSNEDLHLVFAPHIAKDIAPVINVMGRMHDSLQRSRVSIAPLVQGRAGAEYVFDLYRQAALVLGMRFHANVCPLGFGVPTVGLLSYPQIAGLYEDLGLKDEPIDVRVPGFSALLDSRTRDLLTAPGEMGSELSALADSLRAEEHAYCARIRDWLAANGVVKS